MPEAPPPTPPLPHSSLPQSEIRNPQSVPSLASLASLFLRLGFTAFGGPAVHIAMMEDEVVHRRKWLDRQQFLDLVSAINFIPGPNSTELAIHIGLLRAGLPGLLTAGLCFITPAFLIILPLAYLYVTYGHLPTFTGPLTAIRAATVSIILAALYRFAPTALKDPFTITLSALAALTALLLPLTRTNIPHLELLILATSALAGALFYARPPPPTSGPHQIERTSRAADQPPSLLEGEGRGKGENLRATDRVTHRGVLASFTFYVLHFTPPPLALTPALTSNFLTLTALFLKIGSTLFGSGYLLVSYLHSSFVDDRPWLTPQQVTDAIAVGQITPGPLLTTATFVGYHLGHQWASHTGALLGAFLATTAIFLPSFLFVPLLARLWPFINRSPRAAGAFNGMNAAVVALILVTALHLARDSITTLPTALISTLTLAALLLWNLNSTWLILAAATTGWLLLRTGLM